MKKVLILGATGFLGAHIIARFRTENQEQLILPARDQWDLRDRNSLVQLIKDERPDTVINLAAISSTLADQEALYEINAFGVLNLLEALKECEFSGRLIQFSSSNIYGGVRDKLINENIRPLPLNHYSCAKLLAENFCSMFSDDIDAVIVRPFSIIGRGQKASFLLPKLADHFARKAAEIELGNLKVARDFVDARDLAEMIVLIARAASVPPVINLSNGGTVSLDQLLDIFGEISGHTPKILINPDYIRARDITYQCGDNAVVKSLGYRQKNSITDTVRWIYTAHTAEEE